MTVYSFTASNITQTSVTLSYSYYNNQSMTIMLSIWNGDQLGYRLSSPNVYSPYYARSFGNASSYNASVTVTGLTPGTYYQFVLCTNKNTGAYPFDPDYTVMSGQWYPLELDAIYVTTASSPPTWTNSAAAGSARVGSYYSSSISASNATSYGFSNLPPGLSGNTSNGSITGTPNTVGSYLVTGTASNSSGSISSQFYIDAAPALPYWSDSTVSTTMRVGTAYSDSVLAVNASGYSSVGTLPPGISFNTSNASLTGTPTTAGSYSFYFRAYNSWSEYGPNTSTFSVTVKERLPVWSDSAISTSFSVGTSYSDSIAATYASGYSVTSGSLPPGITLNTTTGLLSGNPTTAGAYTFTLGAYNSSSEYIYTSQFSVTVDDPGGKFWVYDGSSWTEREPYFYNGNWSSRAVVYYYDGSIWQRAVQ